MKRFLLLFGLLAVFGAMASATTISVVDNFTMAQITGKITATGSTALVSNSSTVQVFDSTFSRQSTITRYANAISGRESSLTVFGLGDGTWGFSTDDNTSGSAQTIYSVTSGSVDITPTLPGDYVFSIDVLHNDISAAAGAIKFFISDVDSTYAAVLSPIAVVTSGSVTYSALLSSLTYASGLANGLDLTQITSLGFSFTSAVTSQDVSLTHFVFTQVPEPGTYALMGLGLAGLAFLRRRK